MLEGELEAAFVELVEDVVLTSLVQTQPKEERIALSLLPKDPVCTR
jgi:hypothetical protein